MNIGNAIRTLRKDKGYNQTLLAEKAKISLNALSQIERGETFPKKETLNNICEALDTKPNYLLFLSIDEDDVKEDKKEVFKLLYEPLKKLILEK